LPVTSHRRMNFAKRCIHLVGSVLVVLIVLSATKLASDR
jgi:hypothetical protein